MYQERVLCRRENRPGQIVPQDVLPVRYATMEMICFRVVASNLPLLPLLPRPMAARVGIGGYDCKLLPVIGRPGWDAAHLRHLYHLYLIYIYLIYLILLWRGYWFQWQEMESQLPSRLQLLRDRERERGVGGGGRGADATVSNWQPIRCVDFWNVLRQERMNKCHACGASSSWPYYQCRFDETGRQLSEIDSSRWSLASVARTHTHTHIHLYNFFLGRLFRYFWFCFVLFLLIFFTNFLKILNSIIVIIIINIIFIITICMYNNMIFYDFYCIIYDTYITIFFKMVIVIAIWFVCMFVWLNWIVVSFFFGCRDVSSSQL